jgi:hypothetical protein
MQELANKKASEILEFIERLPITVKLAGVTFDNRQHYIKNYASRQQSYHLIREPDNKFDTNAVNVCVSKYKASVGYIPANIAKDLAPALDAGMDIKCGFHIKLINENDLEKPVGLMVKIWI